MGETIQTILQRSFDGFVRRHRLPLHVHRAARAMMLCRTVALGGHAQVCENGHVQGVWYNSCRHRACPQCSFLEIEQWLTRKRDLLLACSHHHVVFTLPHELLALWRWNRRLMADLLLRCAAETLQQLLADPQYLGARAGILVALHTWSRTLQLHPHAHCLVSAGGVNEHGDWQHPRRAFLLPARVVRKLFRGKYLAWLNEHLAAATLVLPSGMTPSSAQALLRSAGRKKWNVRVGERYPHGAGVATYLARYARGGPLKNHRIRSATADTVVFTTRGKEQLSLPIDEFLRRFLEHVPEPGQHRIRAYGLYHRHRRQALDNCRLQLPVATAETRKAPTATSLRPQQPPPYCPSCGAAFVLQPIPRSRDPSTLGQALAA